MFFFFLEGVKILISVADTSKFSSEAMQHVAGILCGSISPVSKLMWVQTSIV